MTWLVVRATFPTSTCRCCSRRWSSTAATRGRSSGIRQSQAERREFPVVVDRLRRVGLARRHPPARKRASRSRSSRRTPASAGPGRRTPTPAAGSTSGNHFYCYSSSPATTGPSTSRSSPSCRRTSSACMDRHGSARHDPVLDRGRRGRLGRGVVTWRVKMRDADGREEELVARAVISGGRPAQPGAAAGHPGRRELRGRVVPFVAAGTTRSTTRASASP